MTQTKYEPLNIIKSSPFTFFGMPIRQATNNTVSARNEVLKGIQDKDRETVKDGLITAYSAQDKSLIYSAKATGFSLYMGFEVFMWNLKFRNAATTSIIFLSLLCAQPLINIRECRKTIRHGESWLNDDQQPNLAYKPM
ncbi:hypothetical protein BN59_03256 [Legionella massiliensis]|uniref:Uncharacterized protein n=1 Tax=Legionella massiliensis TaxID=1034943 RepID=A0A078L192_9GAMM|nr:hypothetical protein [Legionella massiliensis]CDZ78941.1 hypothetical protein BN59_03256 [Legionella massiliensis]CEE14679.1 hypothetical protein BN1094_03256 [Legionella massiliensis]